MEEVVVPAAAVIEVTAEDYCRDLSQRDKRVEMIYAFFKDETKRGIVKDTAANFDARFQAFANRPVV